MEPAEKFLFIVVLVNRAQFGSNLKRFIQHIIAGIEALRAAFDPLRLAMYNAVTSIRQSPL